MSSACIPKPRRSRNKRSEAAFKSWVTRRRTLMEKARSDNTDGKKRAAEALGDGNGMTLSALRRDGDCKGDSEGANGEGPSGVKRAHLDEKEQFVVCDCDIMATVNKVIGGFNLEQAWKEEMDKFSRRLGLLDDLEREFIEIDIAFDKMERDLTKLKEKKSKEQADALVIPEVHFFDVFINDSNFKMPVSPKRAPQSPVAVPKGSPRPVQKSSDDIIPVGNFTPKVPNLPPEGPIVRKELDISSKILATRNFPLGVFFKARITQIQPAEETGNDEPMYRIKFEARKPNAGMRQSKWFSPRELAYADRPSVVLPVGTRVVATYTDESWNQRQSLYAGLVAEPPKPLNRYRYLVFFDDGYAQYVHIDKVFVMCGTSKTGVWDDMYRDVRDFVKTYLQKYPERPMLRMRKGQTVKTEWNGKWWMARVLTVDSSLVKMAFEADNRTEWIYRGSTRFAPLYTALNHTAQSAAPGGRVRRQNLVPAAGKQHRPFVEYTREADENSSATAAKEDATKKVATTTTAAATSDKRNVARKSTTQDHRSAPWEEAEKPGIAASQAGTRELQCVEGSETYNRKTYVKHECSPACVEPEDPEKLVGRNPLSIPCLMGWERQVAKPSKKSKRRVFYTAPCGRRLRNIAEVAQYLALSKCLLTVDQFCFDSAVNVFAHFVPQTVLSSLRDLTYGKELVPVTCINSLNTEYPTYIEYSATRYPGKGVTLNLDEEFLCGCDCEDDCQDRDKCSCQQLTVAATGALPSGVNPSAGYRFRRLHEPLITGVYECNAQCKCSKRCQNRVVQNGLRCRLQVFRTEKRGWGVRCLDDLPQGCFVCIYAGQLLTEQGANEDGNQYGDEYLAELDHIEVVEKQKEGYESDVVNSDEEETSEKKEEDEEEEDDDDEAVSDYDDNSVDEEDLKDDVSDSDGDMDTGEFDGKPRKRSQRSPKKKAKSEDGDSDDFKDKRKDKLKKESRKLGSKLDDSPMKATDDESSESKSQDGRSADQTGDDSQSSTMSEKPKKPLKVKKTTKAEADKAGKGDAKVKTGPLESPGNGTKPPRFPPTRSFFNEEYCYIMDAKNCGNIGRYLNHSCCPNVYVQNVFVDSHDLRFPWVAFFAARYIRAGVELTWDYNYDVGSVPERVMYCQCGADECRGRLI
ncbi:histone-lysine N-methyltransferase SETDB1 isoform X4 [Ixodes scapularis]|uniref:histone-lysine N-methyltransferase SETDB1 isoform X4 n=1 Tax=Ixodes scapularis TaxID=6945 RepID=UPI001A9F23D0|nr:histone-lysine N-methyltransferase SETDB1 isoform X4 [Ixodes scapularis]XP_040066465.1 histone-lysine N-methyltransferase SETDB1 isoform X4 [Ixodes scapularis]